MHCIHHWEFSAVHNATRTAIFWAEQHQIDYTPGNGLISIVPGFVLRRLLEARKSTLGKLYKFVHQPMSYIYNETPLRNPCQAAIDAMGLLTFPTCKVKQGKRDFAMTTMSPRAAWEAIASVAELWEVQRAPSRTACPEGALSILERV